MTAPDSRGVALVYSPLAPPSSPPTDWTRAVGSLSEPGRRVDVYDASLDFFVHHLLVPDRLYELRDRIRHKAREGISDTSGLSDLARKAEPWEKAIHGVRESLETLRSDAFYDPERCLGALETIRVLLNLASRAHSPALLQWGRFSSPAVRTWDQAARFLEDAERNPFVAFCQERFLPRLARTNPSVLVLAVPTQGQLLGALTLARHGKRHIPDLRVILLGDPARLRGATGLVDDVISDGNPQPLADLPRPGAEERSARTWESADGSALSLHGYLAPAPVLPIRGLGLGRVDDPGAWNVLFDHAAAAGVRGLLVQDPVPTPGMLEKPIKGRSPCVLAIHCELTSTTVPGEAEAAHEAGIRLIRWQCTEKLEPSLLRILLPFSHAGIWNHVVVSEGADDPQALRRLASNPNVVHSWSVRELPDNPFVPIFERPGESNLAYSQVSPLPGQPFWRVLDDPAYLLLYVGKHSASRVSRWRVRDRPPRVHQCGEAISYDFVPPGELPAGYLDEICRMVEAGGAVGTKWVRHNLERAFLIGYALEDGVIVGNSSLKHPRPEYVERVREKCGLDISGSVERGYTSVRPEYRGLGIGTKLLEGLTARAGGRKIYSIIREDDLATQKIALRNRTEKVASFYSEKAGKEIGIWMPVGTR